MAIALDAYTMIKPQNQLCKGSSEAAAITVIGFSPHSPSYALESSFLSSSTQHAVKSTAFARLPFLTFFLSFIWHHFSLVATFNFPFGPSDLSLLVSRFRRTVGYIFWQHLIIRPYKAAFQAICSLSIIFGRYRQCTVLFCRLPVLLIYLFIVLAVSIGAMWFSLLMTLGTELLCW